FQAEDGIRDSSVTGVQTCALPIFTHLGNTLMNLFRFEEAISAHDRAIALKPDYGEAHANRGMALMFTSRNGEAAESFDRALSLQIGRASCRERMVIVVLAESCE